MEGNFIKWSNSKWNLINMDTTEMNSTEFCLPQKPENIMFPGLRDFPNVISMCKKFRGQVSVMKDKMLSDELGRQWWGKINGMGGNPWRKNHLLIATAIQLIIQIHFQLVCGLDLQMKRMKGHS